MLVRISIHIFVKLNKIHTYNKIPKSRTHVLHHCSTSVRFYSLSMFCVPCIQLIINTNPMHRLKTRNKICILNFSNAMSESRRENREREVKRDHKT